MSQQRTKTRKPVAKKATRPAKKATRPAKKTASAAKKTAAKTTAGKTTAKKTASGAAKTKARTTAGAAATAAPDVHGAAPTSVSETVAMVRDLAAIVDRRNLAELVVALPGAKVTLRRGPRQEVVHHTQVPSPVAPPVAAPPVVEPIAVIAAPAPAADAEVAPAPAAEVAASDKYHSVKSPFVGTFYRAPNPGAEPFVSVGERVERGQVLCIVEAMKLMNEIEADIAGTIVDVLVEDATPVEYNQELFTIGPL